MRDQSGGGFRLVGTLDNAAHAAGWWDETDARPNTPVADRTLVDPVVHGSLLRTKSRFAGDDEDLILFANPAQPPTESNHNGRRFMTIRRALRESDTTLGWSENKLLDTRLAAYSDMVKIDANTNGILYETGTSSPYEAIMFTRFTNAWVLAKDSGSADKPAWWLRVRDGKIQFNVCDGQLERSVSSTVTVSDNAWHTVSAKRDAATDRLVLTVDGQTTSVSGGTGSLRNNEHVVMGNFNNDSRQLSGELQYLQFYFYQ